MVVVMMSKLHEVYVLAVASNDLGRECVDVRAEGLKTDTLYLQFRIPVP